jgi:Glycosyl hydrolases family 31
VCSSLSLSFPILFRSIQYPDHEAESNGLQCYGHDIGGFEGPQPTPEHLVRWIQLGIHSPRFAINCFKTTPDDNSVGEVIEPWMYPAVTPLIRTAIKRRYELVPYTYSHSLLSHLKAIPPQRWTGWGYETDLNVWSKEIRGGDTQYWFGDALLIGGVYEAGKTTARVYLPDHEEKNRSLGFLNTNAPYQFLEAGKWHDISAIWHDSIAVIARVGSVVPVGRPKPTTCLAEDDPEFPGMAKDDWRGVEIFPPPVRRDGVSSQNGHVTTSWTFNNTWLEDDGVSAEDLTSICNVDLSYTVAADQESDITVRVEVVVKPGASWRPLWLANGLDVILPVGEQRSVVADAQSGSGSEATDVGRDSKGRRVWRIPVQDPCN